MRTLKKSLALVLALVMVLGLGVVGASADNKLDDYTDAKDIGDAYVEAVGVMTGLEIVDGMTETTIDPTATYTREQAAKIIAYMVLGKTAADSLTCTVAPFDDVAADRWSAGYISFCVEQGIIDGMTDTTFEPTGTLTGFQWAKMLLSAVGFNANGEFTGDSWSLNTARVAHSVGLFTGDAAGADHVALQRQQAMLYAFNTLTKVGLVTYSESMGDYFYSYNFGERYTGEGTLGDTVFGLRVDEGIITDNEGNGAQGTYLSDGYIKGNVWYYADTTLDMMYHAARVWYVTGDVAVYVHDLAKVTEYDCFAIDEGKKALADIDAPASDKNPDLFVGKVSGFKPYEYYVIDNSAANLGTSVDNYVGVTYYFTTGVLGTRSESADTVVIDSTRVDNDDVKTDISEINRRDEIIYLVTTHNAYYVYPVSATSGVVTDLDRDRNGNYDITLSDGTVLEMSALVSLADVQSEIDEIEAVLKNPNVNTPAYSFKLDTHGHYLGLSNSGYQTVAYFTGADRITNPGDYDVDFDYEAEFVDVETGDKITVPVTSAWYNKYHNEEGEYFDITDELYPDNATYGPVPAFTNGWSYGDYRYYNEAVFTANGKEINDTDVYYDAEDVTFIIATGAGSTLDIKSYEGVSALIDAYDYNYPVSEIKLSDVCVTVVESLAGNDAAVVVFAHDAGIVRGGYVFFPEDISASEWDGLTDSVYKFDIAYLNGSDEYETFYVDADHVNAFNINAGFYSYTLDANTGYAISLDPIYTYIVDSTDELRADSDGDKVWLNGSLVPADVPVVDLRPESDIDSVDDLADFLYNNYNDDVPIDILYFVNASNKVEVIYVIDVKAVNWTVTAKEDLSNYTVNFKGDDDTVVVDKYSDRTVTVVVTKDDAFRAANQTVNYTVNYGNGNTVTDSVTFEDVAGTTTLEFDVTVDGPCTITINSVDGVNA